MEIIETSLPGVLPIEPRVFKDPRGFFMETYRSDALAALGCHEAFVQDNHSRSSWTRNRPCGESRLPDLSPTSIGCISNAETCTANSWAAAWPGATPGRTTRCWRAAMFMQAIEKRQGLKVACPEEIAYRARYIDAAQVERLAATMVNNGYSQYL